ncbi:MAG: hypothetical protein ABIH41_05705 [Nanoarchaeota archaeon]
MAEWKRKSNFFERILLIVGLGVILLGFHFINSIYTSNNVELWGLVHAVFLWLLLIIMVVMLATEEDVKEELAMIMRSHMEETRLMKEEVRYLKEDTSILNKIMNDQLDELKLMRKELQDHRYRQ